MVIRNELNRIEMRRAKRKMALDGEMINEKNEHTEKKLKMFIMNALCALHTSQPTISRHSKLIKTFASILNVHKFSRGNSSI